MADTKISNLAAITDVQSTDEFVLARAGVSNKIAGADLRSEISGWHGIVVRTSDKDVASSTVLADDGVLQFTATSGSVYEFELMLLYSSPVGSGTPDLKLDFATSSGAFTTGQKVFWAPNTSDTATTTFSFDLTADLTFGTATQKRGLPIRGIAGFDSNSTFTVRWAQNTSGADPVRVHAGSYLRWRRLG